MQILLSDAAAMEPGPLTERLCLVKRIFPAEADMAKKNNISEATVMIIFLFVFICNIFFYIFKYLNPLIA